jgi:outer membrane protein, multidrug efflux system
VALTLLAVFAGGCVTQPSAPPAPVVPSAFEHGGAAAPGAWPAQDWYRTFGSTELESFVDLAVRENADLVQARERVTQADARARQAGAAILPSVDGQAGGTFLAGHSSQGSGHEFDWSAMLSASYEVDFWGRNHATANAARLAADASRAERDALALTLLAGVADQYFEVLALRERSAVARANRQAVQSLLDAVQARFDAGLASPTELATQRAALDAAQLATADLAQQELAARAALALLLGQAPEGFEVRGATLDSLHEPAVVAGLPSELLTRRPDLMMAEANLRAASANLAAARAALFPSLSLTAGAGIQNPALPATVLTIGGTGPSFSLAANLMQPIFNHGKLRAARDEAAAHERELLAAYRAAILAALTDVEKALTKLEQLDTIRTFESDNVAQSERAFEGAQLRYRAGSGDYLTLLEAQRTLYAARDQAAQYRLARLEARVMLVKALGGGWTGSS